MHRQIEFRFQHRRHQLRDWRSAGADPEVDGIQPGVAHRRFQIVERGAIVLAVDDDGNGKVRRTRRVLEEPADPALWSIDGEQELPSAAAIWEIFSDYCVKSACYRIGNWSGVQLHRIMLLRIRYRIAAVIPS